VKAAMIPKRIEISHKTIIFTVFFLLSLWFLYQIRQVLLIFLISLIFSTSLGYWVDKLERLRIPRFLAILLIYVLFLGILGTAIVIIVPPLVSQTGELISGLANDSGPLKELGFDSRMLQSQMEKMIADFGSFSNGAIRIIAGVFGNIFVFFAILVISFYLMLERKRMNVYVIRLFGEDANKRVERIMDQLEGRLGRWIRAQLSLMIIVGIMTYIGLRILGIEYALPLAMLSGFFELIPNIGSVAAAVPGVIAGLSISPLMGVSTAACYLVVQQIQNQIIVPQLMKRQIGVNPLIGILGFFAGYQLGGVGGTILAMPLILIIEILAGELLAGRASIGKSS
jgi:predicted PurR-regulated permease PerM